MPWSLPQGTDKWVHALLFFGELFWVLRALRQSPWCTQPLQLAIKWTVGLAFLTEVVQAGMPARSFEALDVVANLVGTVLAVVWDKSSGLGQNR